MIPLNSTLELRFAAHVSKRASEIRLQELRGSNMKARLIETTIASLLVLVTAAINAPDVMAKNYTYKYKYSETVKTNMPNHTVVSGDSVVLERPVLVERPVVVSRPVVVERPVYVARKRTHYRRRAARVRTHRVATRVVERPVLVERVVERPVVVRHAYRTTTPVVVERQVVYKKKSKGIVPKVYGMIFGD